MINKKQKLNKELFDENVKKDSIRSGFGDGILEAGRKDKRVVVVSADLRESTKVKKFAEKFPERFIEVGVAEQNLASVASGMAAMGKIPFIASFAMFSPGRNWEQIRTTICYNNRPVKIVGSHAGVSVGPDGGTHQALEDMAITRTIPNIAVISPCDYLEAKKAAIACSQTNQPTYIRLARNNTPIITTKETPFKIGKAEVYFESKKPEVTMIATGERLYATLRVARRLDHLNIGITVINLSTIKPLDQETILDEVKKTNAVVTVEDHQIMGGMGSAVAEFLAQEYPVPIEFVGIKDKFGQSGENQKLMEYYEIDERSIEKAVRKVLKRKNSK
jgi:transketolase